MKARLLVLGLHLALGCVSMRAEALPDSTQQPEMKDMPVTERTISNPTDLIAAVRDGSIARIVVSGQLAGLPTLRLSPGQTLRGADGNAAVRFAVGQDGIEISENNKIENLQLTADAHKRVVFNDTSVGDLGVLEFRNLTLCGVVQILAADKVRSGHVEAHGLDIVSADNRAYETRPKEYGVEVIPGAFTLWNQQRDAAIAITADLTEISVGRPSSPVRGSGILLSGGGDDGGRLLVRQLRTGAVYSDAGIAEGTADRISGGIFTCYGAFVDTVHTGGPVTTFGPNDMVLDNWGTVDRWISDEKITSHGASGIGFVNFGSINTLQINAPIETFGQGARGFNVYAGTVQSARFDRIVTRGNGAVGIQIGQPVGRIEVLRGIETFGGTGESLVKGVLTRLSAIAFSVKPEGSVRKLQVAGGLITRGNGVPPLELQGRIESLQVKDDVAPMASDKSALTNETKLTR